MADIETVRRLALALPEVGEGTWFRTPARKVRKKRSRVLKDSWRRKAPKRLIAARDT